MKKSYLRITLSLIILCAVILSQSFTVHAVVWKFEDNVGSGNNPFVPRGYKVVLDGKDVWLSSGFDNGGRDIEYTGQKNGIDYIEATPKSGGDTYEFQALTDRNPTPGKTFLAVYKDGTRMSLGSYTGTPYRGTQLSNYGSDTGWVIPITGFKLDPGCVYEFIYLRGMQANNSITMALVPSSNPNRYLGYVQMRGPTDEEMEIYNSQKNDEYKFVESYTKDNELGDYIVNLIPMRFVVQTYADMKKWDTASSDAKRFADSITQSDYNKGEYKKENVDALYALIDTLNAKAEKEVKLMLTPKANPAIEEMIRELEAMLDKVKNDKPIKADLSKLHEAIKEGDELYGIAINNIGHLKGQYEIIDVDNLGTELEYSKTFTEFNAQAEVDRQTEILKAAIIMVKNSQIKDDMFRFFDKPTGIYVTAPRTSLPKNPALNITKVGKSEPEYQSMMKQLDDGDSIATLYNIQFYKDEKPISPTEEVELQIPLNDKIKAETSNVYEVNNTGELAKQKSVITEGFQKTKTKNLGLIAMIGKEATPEEKGENRIKKLSDKKEQVLKQEQLEGSNDNIENLFSTTLTKKEIFADPIEKLLIGSSGLATFDNDIRIKTNAQNIIIIAAILTIIALGASLHTFISNRRERVR